VSTGEGDEVPLIQSQGTHHLLDWAPNGRRILIATQGEGAVGLWTVPMIDGKPAGSPELVKADIGLVDRAIGFTKDGSFYYAVPTWRNDVYLTTLDPGTGKLSKPTKLVSDVGWFTSVEWSPDGRELVYVYGHGHQPDPFVLGIRTIETGKERRVPISRLTRYGYRNFQARWSPDGRWLTAVGRDAAYAGERMDSEGVYRIDAQSGIVTPIVQTKSLCWSDCVEWAVWSATGKVLYKRSIPLSIVAHDLTESEDEEIYRVPDGGGDVSRLAVSPDGSRVAFVSHGETDSLKLVAVEGGAPRELLKVQKAEKIFSLAWTPDSAQIIYAVGIDDKNRRFAVWRVSAQGGEPAYTGLSMTGRVLHTLTVHADGQRVAFTAGTPWTTSVWMLRGLPQD